LADEMQCDEIASSARVQSCRLSSYTGLPLLDCTKLARQNSWTF
jgi:hypothetical protein